MAHRQRFRLRGDELVSLLMPQYGRSVSNILFPALTGELVLMLWLLIGGVDMKKWKAVDSEP